MENINRKILYIGGFKLPDLNAAAHRVLANGKLFKANGYDLIYIEMSNDSKISGIKKMKVNGFSAYYIKRGNTLMDKYRNFFSIKEIVKIIREEQHIGSIVLYNFPSILMFKIKRVCKKNNIKLIADTTEWYALRGNFIKKFIKAIDVYLRMNIIQKKLDGIIVTSKFLANYYKKFYESSKMILLPTLVDYSFNKWNKYMTKIEYKSNPIRTFIYAGSTQQGKDELHYIINLFSNLKIENSNYVFKIIGITEEQYYKIFNAKKIDKNIKNKIRFLGRISNAEVLSILRVSDFSIFLRKKTRETMAGFPTKFTESISCGTPVITTKTSDLEEYLTEGELGFFMKYDFNEDLKILNKIMKLDDKSINIMKNKCLTSNLLCNDRYIPKMNLFLKNVIGE